MLLSELISSLQDLAKSMPDYPVDIKVIEPDDKARLLPPSFVIRMESEQKSDSILLEFTCKEGNVNSNYIYSKYDDENRKWAVSKTGYQLNPYALNRMLWVMSRYGDNRWWLNPDMRIRSYYQLREPVLIIPFNEFHQGLESLIGRSIDTMEFALNKSILLRESQSAFDSLDSYNNFRGSLAVDSLKERKKGKLPSFSCPY